ncbi:hypothetical protein KUCAC02_021588 [Chaenocephalus aceratus]|uniref:Uncharacterized protein n=1 Tax=Chaenocephalus aceratus TaxID=36190 RepID=A0ACB9XGV4_CHAAC|nr:hypothetical protein KUCAC02_021588 [Chaenocephalus aceratus]
MGRGQKEKNKTGSPLLLFANRRDVRLVDAEGVRDVSEEAIKQTHWNQSSNSLKEALGNWADCGGVGAGQS